MKSTRWMCAWATAMFLLASSYAPARAQGRGHEDDREQGQGHDKDKRGDDRDRGRGHDKDQRATATGATTISTETTTGTPCAIGTRAAGITCLRVWPSGTSCRRDWNGN